MKHTTNKQILCPLLETAAAIQNTGCAGDTSSGYKYPPHVNGGKKARRRAAAGVLLAGVLSLSLFSACSGNAEIGTAGVQTGETVDQGVAVSGTNTTQQLSFVTAQDDYAFDWKSQSYTEIDLSQGSASITQSGIYVLTGTLTDGSMTVNVDKNADEGTVFLVLNGASLHSESGTPLSVVEAKKVVILLEDGTESTVTQAAVSTTDAEFPSAAIFSKADMTITGGGSLTVTTQYNDGITSKDDLIVTGGVLKVTAPGDGLVGKDLLAVETGAITIEAGKDGMRSTNATEAGKGSLILRDGTFTVTAGNDAIQAEQTLQIDGGTFALQTGGGYAGSIKTANAMGGFGGGQRGAGLAGAAPTDQEAATAPTQGTLPANEQASTEVPFVAQVETVETDTAESDSKKALKAGADIFLNGGSFTLSAYEDAVHANGSIIVSDGSFVIQAGDDAVHADAAVVIRSGTLDIQNSFEGIEGANITLAGGTVSIVAEDDGVNVNDAAGVLTISGGEISVKAGGDGLDSNGNFVVSGGALMVDTSTVGTGNSALDCDGTYTGTGGTIVDQNGDALDPSVQAGPGGGGGGKGGGMRPSGTMPSGTQQAEPPAISSSAGTAQA